MPPYMRRLIEKVSTSTKTLFRLLDTLLSPSRAASTTHRPLRFEWLEERQLLSVSTTPTATLTAGYAAELAIDSHGNIFVSNWDGAVEEFSPGSTTPTARLTGLNQPLGLAFDASGDLFVANSGGTTVSEFAPGATKPTATLTGLNDPYSMAFDTNGDLYVANTGVGRVGTTVSEFAPGSTTPTATLTGLSGPWGLAFDSSGNLYVSNQDNGSGTTVSEFAPGSTTPTVTLTGLSAPRYFAFDSSGNLYVGNFFGYTVSKFAPGSTTPTATLTGLSGPWAMAFDSSGNLYVANESGGTKVSVFAPGSTTATTSLTGLSEPMGVAFGPNGDLYVSNYEYNRGSAYVSEFAEVTSPPTVTTTVGALNYIANSGAQLVDSGVTVADSESSTIASATVTISSGYNSGDDSIGFINQNGISGNFNSASGALTLTGTTSISNYQIALRSITFTSTAETSSSRTVSFVINDGASVSTPALRTIDLVAASAAQLVITTQPPATVTAGTDFGFIVTAEDAQGDVATGFNGMITVALAANPGSSTLGGTLTALATDGVAMFSGLSLNKVGSGYTLAMTSGTLTSATSSSISVTPGVATHLVIDSAFPTNVTATALFGFTALAEDAEGNVATSFAGSVSVTLATNPGSSTLSGTTTPSAASGLAVFSGLGLNNVGMGYQLSVTGSGLTAATIGPFNVTALGVATHLVIETPPPSTVAPGAAFGVTVEAEDDLGNVDSSFNSSVSIALANNPGASTLAGTLSTSASAGVAVFTSLSLNNPGAGYTLQATSSNLTTGTTPGFNVVGTLTINGNSTSNNVQITFVDAADFQVVINGGTPTTYSTAVAPKVIYNGPSSTFSEVVFDDSFNTYTATQSFASTDIVTSGFEFDANNVVNLYIYATNGTSTATVTVGTGTESNFYVGDSASDYSYIGDPALGTYSELSGFASEAISGSSSTTYAYVYSTSHGAFVGDPGGSTYTASGFTLNLNDFPQSYAVGAADGTDTMTLHTEGGSFVGQPSFSYVHGTFNGASFLIGTLFAANVTADATNATDQAFFYSYPGNTFNGSQGTSELTGSATGFASFSRFASQATGFQAISVLESGAGTDVANLTSPGNGTFTETATASTLVVGITTVITVNTFFNNNGVLAAVPSKVNITGNANGTDTANLYDDSGTNALVAQGNKSTLTTSVNTVGVTQFGKVNAFQQNGTTDTVHEQSIDFALQTVGNWTSV